MVVWFNINTLRLLPLYHISFHLLKQKLGNLTKETAREYLLKSIYETDKLSAEQRDNSISNHIIAATPKAKVFDILFSFVSFGFLGLANDSNRPPSAFL